MARSCGPDEPQKNSYIDAELAVPLLSGTPYLQLLCVDCLHLGVTGQVDVAVGAAWPRDSCTLLSTAVIVVV